MKTLLRLLLAAGLVLGLATGSLAAIHDGQGGYFGDFISMGPGTMFDLLYFFLTPDERLFSVEDQDPHLAVTGVMGIDGMEDNYLRVEYHQDDFTFGDLAYIDQASGLTALRGSCLFEDLGIFAGVDYLSGSGASAYMASGGYRFDLGGDGFVAASVNYYGGDLGSGSFEFEADAKYLTDGFKVTGQLNVSEDGDYMIRGKADVAVGDDLTFGGGLMFANGESMLYFGGLTWGAGNFLLNGLVGYFPQTDNKLYAVSGQYSFSDSFTVGASCLKPESGGMGLITLKSEFALGQGALSCFYTFPDDDATSGGYIGVGYEVEL